MSMVGCFAAIENLVCLAGRVQRGSDMFVFFRVLTVRAIIIAGFCFTVFLFLLKRKAISRMVMVPFSVDRGSLWCS